MMKKLPKRLKSGRRLVATAADRHVGLYRGGTKDDRTWRIAYATGKVKRGMLGSKGYPIAPKGQKWTWLRTKKRRREEREAKHARVRLDPRAGKLPKKQKKLPISKTQLCVDCGRDPMRKVKHSHTYAHETKGYAVTICCRCARKNRGYKCAIRKQERRIARKSQSITKKFFEVERGIKENDVEKDTLGKLRKKREVLRAEGFKKKGKKKRKLYDLA